MVDVEFETTKKRKPAYTKPKFWVRCGDCRAIYSDCDRDWETR